MIIEHIFARINNVAYIMRKNIVPQNVLLKKCNKMKMRFLQRTSQNIQSLMF